MFIIADAETYYYLADELIDLMDKDYGTSSVITSVDTMSISGAEFIIDGPLSGTGWWDIGLAWIDPDLYPPTLDLSNYDTAVIKLTNLNDKKVAVQMYINYGWDHSGGNRTVESGYGIYTIQNPGETKMYKMKFSNYGIDRPNEIVKIGVHMGMNAPDSEPGFFPVGNSMHVLVETVFGDFDSNGAVDLEDYAMLAYWWLEGSCASLDWCEDADIDKNGEVDYNDLQLFCSDYLINLN